MSMHRAQRPDGWRALVERDNEREREARSAEPAVAASTRAQPRALDDPPEVARSDDEGGAVDRRPARIPVNEAVRDLVRACLIPHVSSDGSASARPDVASSGLPA